jgi:hypothetical protein
MAARRRSRVVIDKKRTRLGRAAHLRWLRAHDPNEHRAHLIAAAVSRAVDALDARVTPRGGYRASSLLSCAARRALTDGLSARADWEAVLDEKAAEEAARSLGHLEALEREIAPHLADLSPEEHEQLLGHLFGGASKAAEALALDVVTRRLGACAAPAVRLFAAARGLSLDEACTRACRSRAIDLLIARALEGVPLERAVRLADERLAAAADIALARHPSGPPDDAVCKGLAKELAQRFDAPSADEKTKSDDPVSGPVRAAWEEAIAAGCSELEAARRCLDVAEAAAREEP